MGRCTTVSTLFPRCYGGPVGGVGAEERLDRVVPVPEYASWPRRIAALVIDWIVSTLVTIGFIGLGGYLDNRNSGWIVLGVFALEVSVLTTLAGGSFGQLLVRHPGAHHRGPAAEPARGDRAHGADLPGRPAPHLQVREWSRAARPVDALSGVPPIVLPVRRALPASSGPGTRSTPGCGRSAARGCRGGSSWRRSRTAGSRGCRAGRCRRPDRRPPGWPSRGASLFTVAVVDARPAQRRHRVPPARADQRRLRRVGIAPDAVAAGEVTGDDRRFGAVAHALPGPRARRGRSRRPGGSNPGALGTETWTARDAPRRPRSCAWSPQQSGEPRASVDLVTGAVAVDRLAVRAVVVEPTAAVSA